LNLLKKAPKFLGRLGDSSRSVA